MPGPGRPMSFGGHREKRSQTGRRRVWCHRAELDRLRCRRPQYPHYSARSTPSFSSLLMKRSPWQIRPSNGATQTEDVAVS